jgi:hypothetical protein
LCELPFEASDKGTNGSQAGQESASAESGHPTVTPTAMPHNRDAIEQQSSSPPKQVEADAIFIARPVEHQDTQKQYYHTQEGLEGVRHQSNLRTRSLKEDNSSNAKSSFPDTGSEHTDAGRLRTARNHNRDDVTVMDLNPAVEISLNLGDMNLSENNPFRKDVEAELQHKQVGSSAQQLVCAGQNHGSSQHRSSAEATKQASNKSQQSNKSLQTVLGAPNRASDHMPPEDGSEEEDDRNIKRQKLLPGDNDSKLGRRLACPFSKRNAAIYASIGCHGIGFQGFRDLR